MKQITLNASIITSGEDGLVLAVGTVAQKDETALTIVFPNDDEEFFQRVVSEGFDLSGSNESLTFNWNIVKSWSLDKKIEFLNFMMCKLNEVQINEIYDRVLFGNTQQ